VPCKNGEKIQWFQWLRTHQTCYRTHDESKKEESNSISGPNDKLMENEEQGVCHSVALPFTLKSILMQKKNYENSNISPCKKIIKKNPLKETKILQDITTLYLISSFNTSQNLIFQKSSHKNRPMT
jgi:hypothetical protein